MWFRQSPPTGSFKTESGDPSRFTQWNHRGHLGEETLSRLRERFYWPGQSEEVKQWCQDCPQCATKMTTALRNRAPPQSVQAS